MRAYVCMLLSSYLMLSYSASAVVFASYWLLLTQHKFTCCFSIPRCTAAFINTLSLHLTLQCHSPVLIRTYPTICPPSDNTSLHAFISFATAQLIVATCLKAKFQILKAQLHHVQGRQQLLVGMQGSWEMAEWSTLVKWRERMARNGSFSSKELAKPPTPAWQMVEQSCGPLSGSSLAVKPCSILVYPPQGH